MCHVVVVFFFVYFLQKCITAVECQTDTIKACRPYTMQQVTTARKPGQGSKRVISSPNLHSVPDIRPTYFTVIVFWCSCKHPCNLSNEHQHKSWAFSSNKRHLHNNNISMAAPKQYQTDLITVSFFLVFLFRWAMNCNVISCLHF